MDDDNFNEEIQDIGNMQIDMPKAKEKMFFIQIGEVQSGLVSRNK